jgi:hypothetical protein
MIKRNDKTNAPVFSFFKELKLLKKSEHLKTFLLLTLSDKFRSHVGAVRVRYGIPRDGFFNEQQYWEWIKVKKIKIPHIHLPDSFLLLYHQPPSNKIIALLKDTTELCARFNINYYFHSLDFIYVMFGFNDHDATEIFKSMRSMMLDDNAAIVAFTPHRFYSDLTGWSDLSKQYEINTPSDGYYLLFKIENRNITADWFKRFFNKNFSKISFGLKQFYGSKKIEIRDFEKYWLIFAYYKLGKKPREILSIMRTHYYRTASINAEQIKKIIPTMKLVVQDLEP